LHSVFGIQPSDGAFAPDFNIFSKNDHVANHVYHRVKHLIIDEISMVRADMLDYLDRCLRHFKMVDEPFGGVQLICVGDFFQLPPVTKSTDLKELKEYGYLSEFAFDAYSFNSFKTVSLNTVLRQADPEFIGILHSARSGRVSAKELKAVNKRVKPNPTDLCIKLTATNSQAEMVNLKQLSLIKEKPTTFEASKYGWWPANPVEQSLVLKNGAQVIIKKNNADKPPSFKENGKPASGKIVNGTICKIIELPTKDHEYTIVELADGTQHNIYKQRWERKEKKSIDGRWSEEAVASYEQHPFQLAWAISMHKSQGQSFDRVHIDASKIFAAGQLYVALSRCRSLEGITLQSPITANKFMADANVLRFEKSIMEHV
jgi:ATP-dependent DNA helicase PIF1